jgi:hypothetical protein
VGKEHETFCREQFQHGTQKVMVFESFELKGERPVRYAFELVAPEGKGSQRTLSLGSYDFTNQVMKRPADRADPRRIFHLDGYTPDGSHQTFAFFEGEPSYEDVRKAVVAILDDAPERVAAGTLQLRELRGRHEPVLAKAHAPAQQGDAARHVSGGRWRDRHPSPFPSPRGRGDLLALHAGIGVT